MRTQHEGEGGSGMGANDVGLLATFAKLDVEDLSPDECRMVLRNLQPIARTIVRAHGTLDAQAS